MPSIPWVGFPRQTPGARVEQPPAATIHPLADNVQSSSSDDVHVVEQSMLHWYKRRVCVQHLMLGPLKTGVH